MLDFYSAAVIKIVIFQIITYIVSSKLVCVIKW